MVLSTARHVIFISLDTTRPDHIGCYGNPWISTPNLDRLMASAVRFSNAYATVPLCAPCRAELAICSV